MGGEEKRHQMMQKLFGDQSEEEEEEEGEEEEEEIKTNPQPNHASGEGEGKSNGEEVETGSEGDQPDGDSGESEDDQPDGDPSESESERDQSSQELEVEVGDQSEESEAREEDIVDAKDDDGYRQRVVTSKHRGVVESESERDDDDEEVGKARGRSGSPRDDKDQTQDLHYVPEIRDVFGDYDDEEEEVEYSVQQGIEQDSNISPMEEEGRYGKSPRPEGILGPSLELEIPLQPPPASPEKMNMIKVSNIMGIEPKPFDPETYVEEDTFVTGESGAKRRIRLGNNIVRWRNVINPDGTTSRESNARFVRWSDGSVQLLIGNEVLDTSVQDGQHDQAHLFRRHEKGILQSQGRLLRKMKFMPSSLSSNSHRQLTALVDSRDKKGYKVKKCITNIDPEKEKEENEKAESQSIRANVLLHYKREKVIQKYPPTVDRRRQLSPGFLEDALDEDDETYYRDSRHSQHHFEEDLEGEALAEKRIMNAKKSKGLKDIPRKSSLAPAKSSRHPMESEYETDGAEYERAPSPQLAEDTEPEYEYEDEEEEEQEYEEEVQVNDASDEEGEEKEHYEEEAQVDDASYEEEEEEEPNQKSKECGGTVKGKGFESDKDSPKKSTKLRRRAVVFDSDEE
ncbi:hypothetical protein RIF29_42359 [Crotalaria pallida]|uniref:Protein LEO1 homolog n=1 Tax=Crotalaria pallida TaxID=3830 RepID=A0AAN9E7F3_CROPI